MTKASNESRWGSITLVLAFSLVLFGLKLWVIGRFGNVTPYWDQWDAEADRLYRPLLDGTLGLRELLSTHNEHRIFITRVLALALLWLNGEWNPLLQMVVNAALHVGVISIAALLMTRELGREALPSLLAFSLALFAMPFGWENTLAGFQSQFYFVILFSLGALWFCTQHPAWSARWAMGVACAVLAFLSLASGVFALAACVALGGLAALKGRRDFRHLAGLGLLLALFGVGVALTPTIAAHGALKASSPARFIEAFATVEAWPLPPSLWAAALRNVPALGLLVGLLVKSPAWTERRWFLGALAFWAMIQAVTTAYGRAEACLSSRYLDLYAMGVLVNFGCLLELAGQARHRVIALAAVLAWPAVVLVTLGGLALETLPQQLEAKRALGAAEETNTRAYLATGDRASLENKAFQEIPYPSAERLAALLGTPEVRRVLPAALLPQLSPRPGAQGELVEGATPADLAGARWFGTFGVDGAAHQGEGRLEFDAPTHAGVLVVPLAGQATDPGISVELEQAGQTRTIQSRRVPGQGWGEGAVRVEAQPFALVVRDRSPSAWVAFGVPALEGRLDRQTRTILSGWYLFVGAGLLLVLGWLLVQGARSKLSEPLGR